ncbi:single-stranded-DNA-specific exonuclease RecJ [Candidatus Dojkabacteria bacterium]|nr:single-stranded-DNA-specific exonuclease RecJ [Candidatus Dojkabacteria bacterium]
MTLESSKTWVVPEIQSTESTIVNDLLKSRGVEGEQVDEFLNPKLSTIPSWKKLFGAEKAAKQIIEAVKNNKKIFIHGDFDVDGISATAVMWEFLYREVAEILKTKVDVYPYIPDRVDEGYGLSKSSVDAMISQGADLIITVDCGVRDRSIIEEYMSTVKCEFIVTDHHQPPEDINTVKYTIVHQMFPGKEFPEEKISGTFVAFLLTNAIRNKLGVDDTITPNSKGLDLVALSTVTDMMPLLGANRTVVKYGIEQMKLGKRHGLRQLLEISGMSIEGVDTYHLGFIIGPRINAAGRIGSAIEALRLLLSENELKAKEYASILHNLNVERQEKTQEILDQAVSLLNNDDNLLFVLGDSWHEGIIGLVASKILERFGKPVIVATKTEDGKYKGSARSIASFNITDAISQFTDSLERYGGHSQAAGFTVKAGQIENFKEKLVNFANKNFSTDLLERTLEIDADISPNDITIGLYNEIEKLKPFGYGNPKPIVSFTGMKIVEKMVMKGGLHLKLKLEREGVQVTALLFNCSDDVETLNVGTVIDVASNITLNEWNGYRNVEIQVKEWRFAI